MMICFYCSKIFNEIPFSFREHLNDWVREREKEVVQQHKLKYNERKQEIQVKESHHKLSNSFTNFLMGGGQLLFVAKSFFNPKSLFHWVKFNFNLLFRCFCSQLKFEGKIHVKVWYFLAVLYRERDVTVPLSLSWLNRERKRERDCIVRLNHDRYLDCKCDR